MCVFEQALTDNGTVLVRVFSIGLPWELFYERISHFAQVYSERELEPFLDIEALSSSRYRSPIWEPLKVIRVADNVQVFGLH